MDRKPSDIVANKKEYVALRKESVDRKRRQREADEFISPSLSARRAWIENGISHLTA